jgi:hypothetical protein
MFQPRKIWQPWTGRRADGDSNDKKLPTDAAKFFGRKRKICIFRMTQNFDKRKKMVRTKVIGAM